MGSEDDLPLLARLPARTLLLNVVVAVVSVLVLVGATIGLTALDESAAKLLATGTRVQGTVLTVDNPSKGGSSMVVTYVVGGTPYNAEIDDVSGYNPGKAVTVIYDPADPKHVRTDREDNESSSSALFVIPELVALVALARATAGLVKWGRRTRALRRAGWEPGKANTVRFSANTSGRITVRFASGLQRVYTPRWASTGRGLPSRLTNLTDERVWVGGDGSALCVAFARKRSLVAVRPRRT